MRDKWRHLGGKHISSYADGEEQLHGTSFAMKGFEILEPTYLQLYTIWAGSETRECSRKLRQC